MWCCLQRGGPDPDFWYVQKLRDAIAVMSANPTEPASGKETVLLPAWPPLGPVGDAPAITA
jgi:hypothetical protein